MTTAFDPTAPHPRLALPRLVAFATPGLCIGALAVGVGVYLPRYYASHFDMHLDIFGLHLAGIIVVGMAFGAVRLIDTLLDVAIGFAMDHTRTRLGRYRVWIAAGAPLLMLPVFMLFIPQGSVGFGYLLGWLFLYYAGVSVLTLSHVSWASVIAANYHERSRVFGAIQVVGVIGATAVLILPIVAAKLTHLSGAGGVAPMGWFIFLAAPIGVALALATTREPVVFDNSQTAFKLRDYWEMISRPDMRRIIVADFCLALGPGWMAALYLFYFHDARGFSFVNANLLLLTYIVAGVPGAGAMSWVAIRLGKHRTLMAASTGYSLGLVAMLFLPKANFPLGAVFMFTMGFLASSFPLLDRAMVADVGDAVRLEKGKQRVSLLYAMITTSQKVALSGSIFLSFLVLGLIGYQAKEGAINTPAAIFGMQLVYIIGPVVFVMLGGACFIGYKLDSKRHAEIRAQLAIRDAMIPEAAILEGLDGGACAPGALIGPAASPR